MAVLIIIFNVLATVEAIVLRNKDSNSRRHCSEEQRQRIQANNQPSWSEIAIKEWLEGLVGSAKGCETNRAHTLQGDLSDKQKAFQSWI